MRTPSTRGRGDWLWALVGLAFGALGWVFAFTLRDRPQAAAAPPGASVAGDEVLRELVEEVRLLRQAIEDRPAEARPRLRAPVSAAPDSARGEGKDPHFERWFAELDERLARLVGTREDASPTSPVGLPGTDFQPLPFPAREEISTQEFSKRHIFWGYQQVVDAYGVPDQISTNPHGSQIWVYDDGDADLEFVFRDGFVLRVEW